jgi:hybrid signal transduction histidine kinase E
MKKYGKIIIIVVGIIAVIALLVLIYFKIAFISKNEVKDIVADNMKVNSGNLYFESIDFKIDKIIYEVEVYYKNRNYEYKIDAKEGKIIYTDFRVVNTNNNQNNSNNNSNNSNANGSNSNNNNIPTTNITVDEAKNIALTHANLTEDNVQFLRTKQEYDDGILVYEIDFNYNTYEYDYKINANTGEIVSYDKDSIYN